MASAKKFVIASQANRMIANTLNVYFDVIPALESRIHFAYLRTIVFSAHLNFNPVIFNKYSDFVLVCPISLSGPGALNTSLDKHWRAKVIFRLFSHFKNKWKDSKAFSKARLKYPVLFVPTYLPLFCPLDNRGLVLSYPVESILKSQRHVSVLQSLTLLIKLLWTTKGFRSPFLSLSLFFLSLISPSPLIFNTQYCL